MIMDGLGWIFCLVFPTLDGVNNPREFVTRAHIEGKQGVLHYLTKDRKSLCGGLRIYSSLMTQEGKSSIITDPFDQSVMQVRESVICEECRKKA